MNNNIRTTQLKHILSLIKVNLIMSIGIMLMLWAIMWPILEEPWLYIWGTLTIAVAIGRLILTPKADDIKTDRTSVNRYFRFIMAALFVSSTLWGMTTMVVINSGNPYAVAVICLVIAAMSSGGQPSLSAYVPAYLISNFPTFCFLAIALLMSGMTTALIIAALYLVGMIFMCLLLNKIILRAIKLDLKNVELLAQVTHEKEKAEYANRSKSEFLAAASHDLRQPLHAIGLLLDSLTRRLNNNKHDTQTILHQLSQSHESLSTLFNSLLEISRLDSGLIKASKSHHQIAHLLSTITDEFEPWAESVNVALVRDWSDEVIYTDAILLNRIVRNLLSNAIKFTPEGGTVTLRAQADKQYIDLTVSDTGIGIPPEEFDNIFIEQHQLNNHNRNSEQGYGLGLAVVKKMTDLLGHKIHIQSEVNQGTSFNIRLDRGEYDQLAASVDSDLDISIQGTRILAVDDDRAVLNAMATMLTDHHCDIHLAHSCDEAITLIEQHGVVPHIIVSDYRLEESLNGIEAVEKIRATLKHNTPAIIISGDTDPELSKEIRGQGFFLLHKPVKTMHMKRAIQQSLD